MHKLNVFSYGYLNGRHPIHNFKQFIRNCKYADQRITRGYSEYDLWDFDYYCSNLFYYAFHDLAKYHYGSPASMTHEEGENYLLEMAEHFLNTQESNDELPINIKRDQLWTAYNKYRDRPDLMTNVLRDDGIYYERQAAEFREAEKDKAIEMLRKAWFDLWD